MSILLDVAKELLSMFVADLRLAVGVLSLVILVALALEYGGIAPLAGGGLLLVGSLLIVIEATVRQARGS
ncbi:hypothetical protein FHS85_004938 [Rhodoligotrophos appendicifer]|uniref:hypothetical protein n=1 Tax=Rhodoligotrophos appendicifer TaxID=987056 RepID=UPI0011861C10|nr:hypothetical protein [Rhodoligotrophos appendicifer]